MARPFLKWAGGKRQLMDEIMARLPSDFDMCNRYVEPFVGGGAVFFHLQKQFEFEEIHLADLNPELILCYRQLQSDATVVWDYLSKLIESYPESIEERKPVFYSLRDLWNGNVGRIEEMTTSERSLRAAQTIFMNKTCFNGLFRLNRSGEFNVPIGSYVKPSFPSKEDLLDVQIALDGVIIHLSSFQNCSDFVDSDSFVYFDPPYRPLSKTSHFVSYSKGDFNDDDQKRLAALFCTLDGMGAQLLLSNSDPKNTVPDDDFFDDLYAAFRIERVRANRAINSNPDRRGPITELLIRNY